MPEHKTIFTDSSGRVVINVPVPKAKRPTESIDAWQTRTEAQANQEGLLQKVARVSDYEFPGRELRDAWRIDAQTGNIRVDLAVARKLKEYEIARLWRYNMKEFAQGLEWAKLSGDTVAEGLIQQDLTRMGKIPAQVKDDLDRMEADGDEAAIGALEPDWPTLEA